MMEEIKMGSRELHHLVADEENGFLNLPEGKVAVPVRNPVIYSGSVTECYSQIREHAPENADAYLSGGVWMADSSRCAVQYFRLADDPNRTQGGPKGGK
jgi:hypothetical protein